MADDMYAADGMVFKCQQCGQMNRARPFMEAHQRATGHTFVEE